MKQFDFDNDEVIDDKENQQSFKPDNKKTAQDVPGFNDDENIKAGLTHTVIQKLIESFSIMWVAYALGGALVLYVIYSVGVLILPSTPKKLSVEQPAFSEHMFQSQSMDHRTHIVHQQSPSLDQERPDQAQLQAASQQLSINNTKIVQNMQALLNSQLNDMQKVLQKALLILNDNTKQVMTDQQKTQKEVDGLANSMIEMQRSLSRLTSYVHELDVKIDETVRLSPRLKQISEQLSLLQAEKTNLSDKLSLVAVVGDRAWLQDQHGSTVTVTTGDQLDNYGKILKIDDEQERVYTSSGFVCK